VIARIQEMMTMMRSMGILVLRLGTPYRKITRVAEISKNQSKSRRRKTVAYRQEKHEIFESMPMLASNIRIFVNKS
jgi:hypothetical protein